MTMEMSVTSKVLHMGKKKPSQPPPPDDGYHEFTGEHDDPAELIRDEAMEALNSGDAASLAQHLRELNCSFPDLLHRIADLLDPKNKKGLRLKFVGPKGRPANGNRVHRDSMLNSAVGLAMLKLKTQKLESAIEHVSKTTGDSRARILRALARFKPKKPARKKKEVR
jgi:hypothetical protein